METLAAQTSISTVRPWERVIENRVGILSFDLK